MKSIVKLIAASLTMVLLAITPAQAQEREEGVHYLALYITDNSEGKMTTVLNVAANATQYYESIGEELVVRIVAFNAGLHMLREDTSPVLERLTSFSQSMPNVAFVACGNTIAGMSRKAGGVAPPIVGFAEHVPAGVVDLMTLQENGWTLIRP